MSLNREKWEDFSNGMPNVAVHDVVIQRKRELVVGHGRSIYKVNVDQIEQLTDKVLAENVHIFEINKIKNQKIGNSWSSWAKATDKSYYLVLFQYDSEVVLQVENSFEVIFLKSTSSKRIEQICMT
jgi:hypothetical protein